MTNDDMMTGGRSKMTKLLMLIFQLYFIKPSLEICYFVDSGGVNFNQKEGLWGKFATIY